MGRKMILLGIALLGPALTAADVAPATRSVADLKTFYQARCASCHGDDGSAHSATGAKLRGSDFTDAKAMQRKNDAALAKTIRKGIFFGFAMPSFDKDLSEAEIALLVKDVLRTAEKGRVISGKTP